MNFGRETVSGVFKDLKSALWAFGTTLAHRQNLFLTHASQFSYGTPTEDHKAYWTYVYYQVEDNTKDG